MRKITRRSLAPNDSASLKALQRGLDEGKTDGDPWKRKPRKLFSTIRRELEAMAPGRTRCMYCHDSLATDIEHFWPRSDYPEQTFVWTNYLLACGHCNSNAKRDQFPLDGDDEPLLIDPTVDEPREHLLLSPASGEFVPVGKKGPESIRVFGLNAPDRRNLVGGRKSALVALIALLKQYDDAGAGKRADIRETMTQLPFDCVLYWLVDLATQPVPQRCSAPVWSRASNATDSPTG